jgi:hypothetical protein
MWIPFRIKGREMEWATLPGKPNGRLVVRSRTGNYAVEATLENCLWGGLWLRSPRLLGNEFPLGQRAPDPPPVFYDLRVEYLHTELIRSFVERWAYRKSFRIKPRDSSYLVCDTAPRNVIITNAQEWIEVNDIYATLRIFQKEASPRKWRLFAVACCRRVWHLLTNDSGRRAVDLAERFADDEVSIEELRNAWKDVIAAQRASHCNRNNIALPSALSAARNATDPGPIVHSFLDFADARRATSEREFVQPGPNRKRRQRLADRQESCAQSALIRDILGNPFLPASLAPSCVSRSVMDLAHVIYTEKSFHLLHRLGAELQIAGCNDPSILQHCRSPLPHVRGCWVVDLVLGKK